MAGKIIMCAVAFGCALLFFGIGVYARRLDKPMWFWTGTEVDPSTISDIKKYNKENAIMWQTYSLWYFASGIAEFCSSVAALVFLISGCSIGLVILVASYNRIYKKYSIK